MPVALTTEGVRAKLEAALRGARGQALASDEAISRYVDELHCRIRQRSNEETDQKFHRMITLSCS